MKNKTKTCALVLASVVIFSGCSKSSAIRENTAFQSSSMAAASPSRDFANNEIMPDTGGETTNTISFDETGKLLDTLNERKLVKNAHFALETRKFDTATEDIIALCERMEGYVQNQQISGNSYNDKSFYRTRNADFTLRIPASKLDSFTAEISSICNVIEKNEYIDDITDSYYDIDARLNMLKTKEERLIALLEKAEKLEDIITIETALADCRAEIEMLSGRLRRMDNMVSYSTIEINLREVVEYTEANEQPKTFQEKIAQSFKRSGEKIVSMLEGTLFFVIEDLPVLVVALILPAAIFAVIAVAVAKSTKKRREKYPIPENSAYGKAMAPNKKTDEIAPPKENNQPKNEE